jgi:hypothetical protein
MLVQQQFRRGTSTEWTTANPVLAEGEVGVDLTQSRFKIGDGTTAWNDLDFSTGQRGESMITYGKASTIATATGKIRYKFPFNATIIGVSAAVGTAPTGSPIIIDINKNGTTMFTTQANRPQIDIGAFSTASEVTDIDVDTISAGDYITVDIDQVGSSTPGSDLSIFVRYY